MALEPPFWESKKDLKSLFLTKAKLKRITKIKAINTEPNFSYDGKYIFFTSDQGGSPQIYKMRADGRGFPKRVTFKRKFNARPVAGPNGDYLAYVTSLDGDFVIAILNLKKNEEVDFSGSVPHWTTYIGDEVNWMSL